MFHHLVISSLSPLSSFFSPLSFLSFLFLSSLSPFFPSLSGLWSLWPCGANLKKPFLKVANLDLVPGDLGVANKIDENSQIQT